MQCDAIVRSFSLHSCGNFKNDQEDFTLKKKQKANNLEFSKTLQLWEEILKFLRR